MYEDDPNADRPLIILICVLFGLFALLGLAIFLIEQTGFLY